MSAGAESSVAASPSSPALVDASVLSASALFVSTLSVEAETSGSSVLVDSIAPSLACSVGSSSAAVGVPKISLLGVDFETGGTTARGVAGDGADGRRSTTGNGPVSSRPVKRAVSISASSSSIVVSETLWPAVSAAARASDIEIVNSSEISSSDRRTTS